MKNNFISIIINCYNGEKYLDKTLQSILNQNYKNYEVVFLDNNSTDSSAKIYKKIKDKRFKYYKTKRKIKLYNARNVALRKCKGDFIAFIDTDDWWESNYLVSRYKFYNSSELYGFCYSNCFHYYENKKIFKIFWKDKLPSGFILEELLKNYFVKLGTLIIKRKLMSLKFNSHYNIIGDYDFVIRSAKNLKGMGFQDKLVNIRFHQNNFTHKNRKMFYEEFKHWINSQNFKNKYFKRNKFILEQRLEYLRLIHLLINKKQFHLIYDILKFNDFFSKIKLLMIFFIPSFLIKIKVKFF